MSGREEFIKRVDKWSKMIGVEYKEIHIRDMKNKWASCSSRGRLTFDRSLLDKSPDFQDRVIVHELLHLRYPNHGRMFKLMMKQYLGFEE